LMNFDCAMYEKEKTCSYNMRRHSFARLLVNDTGNSSSNCSRMWLWGLIMSEQWHSQPYAQHMHVY